MIVFLADVLGDVFLGVVGPHLLLVDVLLEDVAEHVGVDLVVGAQGALVEVPVVRVEEVEELLEGLVGDVRWSGRAAPRSGGVRRCRRSGRAPCRAACWPAAERSSFCLAKPSKNSGQRKSR